MFLKLSNGESIYVKNGSTEFQIANSTGDLFAARIFVGGSTATVLSDSSGQLYNKGEVPVFFTEAGTTSTGLKSYGQSILPYSSAANLFTLNAPITGVEKVICLDSTKVADTTAINTAVYTGSTAILIMDSSTTYAPKLFINMLPPYASVRMVGLSTATWGVLGTYGAVQLTTAAGYTT